MQKKRHLIFLGMVLVLSTFLKIFAFPHAFYLYLDDYYPLEVANKIVHQDFRLLNTQFIANGLLFVPGFLLFGAHSEVAIYTIILLSIASLVLLYMLAFLVTKEHWSALFTTVLVAFNAAHIHYSLSTYNHLPVFFFIMMGLVCLLLYLKLGHWQFGYLFALSFLYLVLLRVEMVLLLVLFLAIHLKHVSFSFKRLGQIWIFLSAGMLLMIPRFVQYREQHQQFSMISMSLGNFSENFLHHSLQLLSLTRWLLLLCVLGAVIMLLRRQWDTLILLTASLIMALFYFFLDPGHIDGGRHLHFPSAMLFIAIGVCLSWLIGKIQKTKLRELAGVVLIAILSVHFVTADVKIAKDTINTLHANQVYFDTKLAKEAEKRVPSGCILVNPHPQKYTATTQLPAIAVHTFLNLEGHLLERCFILADDFSCVYPPEEVYGQCESIRQKYRLDFAFSVDSKSISMPSNVYPISSNYYYIR